MFLERTFSSSRNVTETRWFFEFDASVKQKLCCMLCTKIIQEWKKKLGGNSSEK